MLYNLDKTHPRVSRKDKISNLISNSNFVVKPARANSYCIPSVIQKQACIGAVKQKELLNLQLMELELRFISNF